MVTGRSVRLVALDSQQTKVETDSLVVAARKAIRIVVKEYCCRNVTGISPYPLGGYES